MNAFVKTTAIAALIATTASAAFAVEGAREDYVEPTTANTATVTVKAGQVFNTRDLANLNLTRADNVVVTSVASDNGEFNLEH